MPLEYMFKRASDGAVMELSEIDRLICIETGRPLSDDEDFSPEFNIISLIGDRVCGDGDGTWKESVFMGLTIPDDLRMFARKFLNGEYVYKCWYSRGGHRRR